MTLRHGNGTLRVETLQADEQTAGVPAPAAPANVFQSPDGSRVNGTLTATPEGRRLASEMGKVGGKRRAEMAKQVRALTGLGIIGATPEWLRPYADDADQFCKAEVERLALECGGGTCPQNAAILVQQAALAMAGSRAAYATGDVATGAKLTEPPLRMAFLFWSNGVRPDYWTPAGDGEEYELTLEHIEQWRRFDVPVNEPERFVLIVETGDEVLDYRLAVHKYAGAEQIVVPGGDHSL